MPPAVTLSLADAFTQAMAAYEGGRMGEARRLARRLADDHPDFGGVHYLLGLLALNQTQGRRAADHLARAIAITPGQSALHLAMGQALDLCQNWPEAARHYRLVLDLIPNHAVAHQLLSQALHKIGNLADALTHAEQACQLAPHSAESWHQAGLLHLEAGQIFPAINALRHAVSLRPDWATALNNFGLALRDAGQLEQAVIILQGAVELTSNHAGYITNLASTLRMQGRLHDARHHADRAVRIGPRQVEAWLELGQIRHLLNLHDAAATAFDRATTLAPQNVAAWYSLAETRRAQGDRDKAIKAYEKCLELDPEDRHGAALGLALAGGHHTPDKAPEAYVRQLFDDYADKFDHTLTEKLDYCAPQLLDEVLTTLAPRASEWSIIDIGCGTGLAAPMLRHRAKSLHGIDLSPAMVEKARQRNLYDHLSVGELVSQLSDQPDRYDLVLAADVLVYLGDLEPVFQASHRALHPGGLFAFTVERSDETPSYSLGSKQRYAHAAGYLRQLAGECGYDILHLSPAVTRRDGGHDVPGYVVVLRSLAAE